MKAGLDQSFIVMLALNKFFQSTILTKKNMSLSVDYFIAEPSRKHFKLAEKTDLLDFHLILIISIKILRDTGAFQYLTLADLLTFSSNSSLEQVFF